MNAVPAVRATAAAVMRDIGAADYGVGGQAPAIYDISSISNSDLLHVIPIAARPVELVAVQAGYRSGGRGHPRPGVPGDQVKPCGTVIPRSLGIKIISPNGLGYPATRGGSAPSAGMGGAAVKHGAHRRLVPLGEVADLD